MKTRAILTLFAIALACMACGTRPAKEIPANLLGTWKSRAPGYEDRFLELRKGEIVFGTGSGNSATYTIIDAEAIHGEKQSLYTIHYTDQDGTQYQCRFYYDGQGGGVIRFVNQTSIEWTKVS